MTCIQRIGGDYMKQTTRSCVHAVIGGLCVYVVEFLYALIPYIDGITRSVGFFSILFIAGNLLGALITAFVLLYEKPSMLQMLFRFIILYLTLFVLIVLNGYAGTITALYTWLSIGTTSGSNNVSGLLTLTFYAVVVTVSIIILSVTAISRACKYIAHSHKE